MAAGIAIKIIKFKITSEFKCLSKRKNKDEKFKNIKVWN
jgi:hypothetical protein